MAGLGKKTFTAGEVLTAADVNGYLMEQSVMVFGGTAARSSAVPSPSEGMISYLTDSDVTETFNGTAWASVLNPPINAQAGTAYTFTRVDASRTVTASNGSASTYTVPPQADVAWPDGATLTLRNLGAGVVTIAGGSGVTVTNTAQTVAQYGSVKIIRTGSNAWTVLPDSGGSQTETVLASGSYTAQSTINFTNLLSDTYKFYSLRFYFTNNSVNAQDLNVRFRENTSDKTANYYQGGSGTNVSGTVGTYWAANNGSYFTVASLSSSLGGYVNIQIARPSATTGHMTYQFYSPYVLAGGAGGGTNTSMSNFTGLTVYGTSGTTDGYYILTGIKP